MTKTATDTLLEVLQEAGLPINGNTIDNVRKVVEADLALVVASWVDLAHAHSQHPQDGALPMTTSYEALQAILDQFQAPLDHALLSLQGELGAHVEALEAEGRDEEVYETNALDIYNAAYELRLQVKAFFETWLDK